MNPYLRNLFGLTVTLAITLSSCGPKPTIPAPTSTPTLLQPTNTQPVATNTELVATANIGSLFEAGLSYSDASDDMAVSFLDVVAFQAAVNEEAETLEVVLHMRDIPETATKGQVLNFVEYSWDVAVYIDHSKINQPDWFGDYHLSLSTLKFDPSTSAIEGILTPEPGEPVTVPFSEIWDTSYIYNELGEIVSELEITSDPESDTLTLSASLPGITSDAVFSFSTFNLDSTMDRPDNDVTPEAASLSTPLPEDIQATATVSPLLTNSDESQLTPVGTVRAYPGPQHYQGDVLTFEILVEGDFSAISLITLKLDNQAPRQVSGEWLFDRFLVPLALDTANLSGRHTVNFSTADGSLNHTYAFEVLPASQRPEHEENAAWAVNEIDCCLLHYISGAAAARDIEFIAEHFQQAADDFVATAGKDIDRKLVVYILDRIWGNGGFGGNGEIVISYTDRYYGPTIGAEGLEILGRHELTHAVGLGEEQAGDGVFINSEGLAVYVAGGHYKPEPLAKRGAALYDLGHNVSVGQFIDQHELSYLHAAVMLTYIVERYGPESLWKFLAADEDKQDGQLTELATAIRLTFGISLQQFDQDFEAWLESKDPGEQLDDLRLTIELQDLRRQYQETYSPPPYFIFGKAEDAVAQPEYLPVVIREANSPANAAAELIIADGQQAIVDGDYVKAEQLITMLRDVVNTGKFENALAKDYLELVLALKAEGYEVLSVNIQGAQATVQVTVEPPLITSLELQKIDGNWQVKP